MSTWTSGELDTLGNAAELSLSARRPDGTLRPAVPVWVVRAGDDVYVRSYKGTGGVWFRHVSRQCSAHVSVAGLDRDVTAEPAGQFAAQPGRRRLPGEVRQLRAQLRHGDDQRDRG